MEMGRPEELHSCEQQDADADSCIIHILKQNLLKKGIFDT